MPDGVTVKIDGLAELERNMNRLQEDLAKKHAVAAIKIGAKYLHDLALANARALFKEHSGLLFRGIKVAIKIYGRGVKGATVWAHIGLARSGGALGKKLGVPWYGRILETGWRHIGHSKKQSLLLRRLGGPKTSRLGAKRKGRAGLQFKQIKKRPWMAPTMDHAGEVIEKIAASLRGVFGG
jgi:hypothetical protein